MTDSQSVSPTAYFVDDDPPIRRAVGYLMESVGIQCQIFDSATDCLAHFSADILRCLVLDIRMPGLSGLELQDELAARDANLSIIFIIRHGDVPMAVEAMQQAAFDFIQEPFRDQELLDRVSLALEASQQEIARKVSAQWIIAIGAR